MTEQTGAGWSGQTPNPVSGNAQTPFYKRFRNITGGVSCPLASPKAPIYRIFAPVNAKRGIIKPHIILIKKIKLFFNYVNQYISGKKKQCSPYFMPKAPHVAFRYDKKSSSILNCLGRCGAGHLEKSEVWKTTF